MTFYHIVGVIFHWIKLWPLVSTAPSIVPVRGNALSTIVSVANVSNNVEDQTVSNQVLKCE